MSFSIKSSKMGARQGLAQTHIAAYDHAQRSAPPIDLVWLTWSWMFVHDIRESLRVNGLGALHLRNGSESQRPDSSCALPHSWAVHSFNQNVRTPSRSGDGALLNSDMRGRDPFDDKMIELLTKRADSALQNETADSCEWYCAPMSGERISSLERIINPRSTASALVARCHAA